MCNHESNVATTTFQKSFEWFISLLDNMEKEQEGDAAIERFLTFHLYMTGALQPCDIRYVWGKASYANIRLF